VGPEENPIEKDRRIEKFAAKKEVREMDTGTLGCRDDTIG